MRVRICERDASAGEGTGVLSLEVREEERGCEGVREEEDDREWAEGSEDENRGEPQHDMSEKSDEGMLLVVALANERAGDISGLGFLLSREVLERMRGQLLAWLPDESLSTRMCARARA